MSTTEAAGKWVLVTGGSRGIGSGVASHLARLGYDVVFTYKSSEEAAQSSAARLRDEGCACRALRCDGGNPAEIAPVVEALIAEKGAPYALVNNLGITRDGSIVLMDQKAPLEVLTTNVGSAFWFTSAVLRAMIELRDGVIIQMSSISAFKGNAGQSAYAASKAAMIGLTRALAVELGRFNIRVNAVAPGLILTDMIAGIPDAHMSKLKTAVPLRRIGSVEDVAPAVAFLLSRDASYITGMTMVVDGGLSC